jgi:hypothetical protein
VISALVLIAAHRRRTAALNTRVIMSTPAIHGRTFRDSCVLPEFGLSACCGTGVV